MVEMITLPLHQAAILDDCSPFLTNLELGQIKLWAYLNGHDIIQDQIPHSCILQRPCELKG